jgi:hypothetical protein
MYRALIGVGALVKSRGFERQNFNGDAVDVPARNLQPLADESRQWAISHHPRDSPVACQSLTGLASFQCGAARQSPAKIAA